MSAKYLNLLGDFENRFIFITVRSWTVAMNLLFLQTSGDNNSWLVKCVRSAETVFVRNIGNPEMFFVVVLKISMSGCFFNASAS